VHETKLTCWRMVIKQTPGNAGRFSAYMLVHSMTDPNRRGLGFKYVIEVGDSGRRTF